MTSRIEKRLAELKLILPPVTAPPFSDQPVVIARGFAYVAGQPLVANAVSDMMVEIMGDAGRHARFAVGTIGPADFACSVEGVFLVD